VMQGVYAYQQDAFPNDEVAVNTVCKSINAVYNIVLYNLLLFTKVAQHVLNVEISRSKKHLPTDDDRNFSIKFSTNQIATTIAANKLFNDTIKQRQLGKFDTDEVIRVVFNALYELNDYKLYSITETDDMANDKAIIALLYNEVMLKNAVYENHIDEVFPNMTDDIELAKSITKDFIHDFGKKPFSHFINDLTNTKDQEDFAADLFNRVKTENDFLQKLIEPHLENWEADRIAIIDMILMKLALAEILYFETIPIKVSMNEYIEVAKLYSTPKSKDFINGILDKTMKLLRHEGKIQKAGRGLME
jgi:N utilization substance protein B